MKILNALTIKRNPFHPTRWEWGHGAPTDIIDIRQWLPLWWWHIRYPGAADKQLRLAKGPPCV